VANHKTNPNLPDAPGHTKEEVQYMVDKVDNIIADSMQYAGRGSCMYCHCQQYQYAAPAYDPNVDQSGLPCVCGHNAIDHMMS
jgi:hypothetical protein